MQLLYCCLLIRFFLGVYDICAVCACMHGKQGSNGYIKSDTKLG